MRARTGTRKAVGSLSGAPPPRLLSPFVLAELDYLLAARVGKAARTSLLREVLLVVWKSAARERLR
jgi:hypothetical protein